MAVIMSKIFVLPKSGILASNLDVGSSVFLNVDGVSKEFLVVHHGNPNTSLYDASCDGTWLLMKDIYESRVWGNSNDYSSSNIHTYLNGDFIALLDENVQSIIKQIRIPYHTGTSMAKYGLSTKVFLLSGYEVGFTQSGFPVDGACLSYFNGTAATDSKRIAYLNGTATNWWLRSLQLNSALYIFYVDGADGGYELNMYSNSNGVRPAIVIPSNTLFDPDTKELL